VNAIALGLVLVAAFLHAIWNCFTKTSLHKLSFIWWFMLASLMLYFPLFVYHFPQTTLSPKAVGCIFGSGLLHGSYFWFLGGAYEKADLSLVYPISRGATPIFVAVLAAVLIKERLSFCGIIGISLVVLGIYILHLKSFDSRSFFEPFSYLKSTASFLALATGASNGAAALIDKVGVHLVSPPVYIYLMFSVAFMTLCPLPFILGKDRLRTEWHVNGRAIAANGVLVLLTYLLTLFAMRISLVSYVITVRNASIVFSALFGILWLGERHGPQKLVGAVFITAGVVLIGFSS